MREQLRAVTRSTCHIENLSVHLRCGPLITGKVLALLLRLGYASSYIDPLGRIVKSLPLGAEGVLDAPLPQPIAATLYARWGDALVAVVVAIAFLWVLGSRWRAPPA